MADTELIVPFRSLTYLNQSPLEGGEKTVYKMTDGVHIIAAKIFLDQRDPDVFLHKAREARREYSSYIRLRGSKIRDYIVEPYYLLSGPRSGIIGLAVEWRDGEVLADESRQCSILEDDINQLEGSMVAAAHEGLKLDSDSFGEYNLLLNPNYSPRIFLAECKLVQNTSLEAYLKGVSTEMEYLRNFYITPN